MAYRLTLAAAFVVVAVAGQLTGMALAWGDVELAEESVRSNDPRSAALFREARGRSSIVRHLIHLLNDSNVLVFLDGSNEPGNSRGATRLISAPGRDRMLRVTINMNLGRAERIAVLAHELQHAREVALDPFVRDQDAMRRLFARIGLQTTCFGGYFETLAAQEIERQVRRELGDQGLGPLSENTR